MTAAQQRGLGALARTGNVYWQTADWLVERGYAIARDREWLTITQKGRAIAKAIGLDSQKERVA